MTDSLQQLRTLVDHQDIRAVVSDLDGVLRIFEQGLWTELDEQLRAAPGTALDAILLHPCLEDVVRGRSTHARWQELAASTLVEGGAAPSTARAVVDRWASTPATVDPDVLEALTALREQGCGVFVLTNGTDRVPTELADLGLTDFLGERGRFLLNTADLGAAKPEPEAFERAHARIERELATTLHPEQVAFLDDSEGHVRAAEVFGWHALHHRTV